MDAIVNAAAPSLLGGGGVDGAIHAAAGPRLLARMPRCRRFGRAFVGPTGEARITPGFDLPAKWVIHTVGPVWSGDAGDEGALAACYANSLKLAAEHLIATIAFPAISTGAYGFPAELAATIAVRELRRGLRGAFPGFTRVIACCFDLETQAIYREITSRQG